MKTFSKGSPTGLLKKMAPGGGTLYQIPPDVALTICIQIYSKGTQKAICGLRKHGFWIQGP